MSPWQSFSRLLEALLRFSANQIGWGTIYGYFPAESTYRNCDRKIDSIKCWKSQKKVLLDSRDPEIPSLYIFSSVNVLDYEVRRLVVKVVLSCTAQFLTTRPWNTGGRHRTLCMKYLEESDFSSAPLHAPCAEELGCAGIGRS
jgi:hypothetical protein